MARAEKRALLKEAECAREKVAAMEQQADVHTKQLEALMIVKRALSAEVRCMTCPHAAQAVLSLIFVVLLHDWSSSPVVHSELTSQEAGNY